MEINAIGLGVAPTAGMQLLPHQKAHLKTTYQIGLLKHAKVWDQ